MLEYTQYVWECLYRRNELGTIIEGYSATHPNAVANGKTVSGRVNALANSSQGVVVIGCGFGNTLQELIDLSFTGVAGIDASPYVHANLVTEVSPEVAGRIVQAAVGVDSEATISSLLTTAVGQDTFTWVIDEDAITAMADAEVQAFLDGCEALQAGNGPAAMARIVHVVSTTDANGKGDSGLNWKSKAEWEAYAPNHTWLTWRELRELVT